MRIGIHISISEGLENTARRAAEIGCETIQIFAANPSAWHSRDIDPNTADLFRGLASDLDLRPVVVHTPYLLNLASPDPNNYGKSAAALADSLRRATLLGAQYVVTHIGSRRGESLEPAVSRICEAISEALDRIAGNVVILLENSAGAGESVGSRFEELRTILDCLEEQHDRLGICLDTAHLWGAGYDISLAKTADHVIAEFDATVGIDRLMLLHLNDTCVPLGSHRDRHANIGTGNIGEAGFAALLHHPALMDLPGIIETPPRADNLRDIDVLKRLRDFPAI
jgi:deoxyribonuclease IV